MTDDLEQRIANLRRMHDTAQTHIGRLQAQIGRMKTNLADQVFGK